MDLKPDEFSLVLALAERKALRETISASTLQLSREMGVSQQTVSRWLITLSNSGYVERDFNSIRLTQKAKDLLVGIAARISMSLKDEGDLPFDGAVVPGMQDGKYYLSIPEYVRQIEEKVGFKPFPGTLNLKLRDPRSTQAKQKLMALPGMRITGFKKDGKMFGPAKLFNATIARKGKGGGEISCAVILPDYTHYGTGMLEVIADESLRKKLKLANNAEVKVRVKTSP